MKQTDLLLALVFALLPSVGWAQTGDASTRRELIQRAQEAATAGRHAEALDLGLRAGQIELSTSLRAFLINEQRSTGHLAAALDNAEQCFREATTNTALPDRPSILAACSAASAALATQVSHIIVRTPSPGPDGLRVTVNGVALRSAVWGVPYVVDAGDIVVRADAPGFRPFEQTVHVSAGATTAADVVVTLRPAPHVTPGQNGGHDTGPSVAPPIVVGLVGLAGVGVAIGLGLATQGSYSSYDHTYCLPPDYVHCQASTAAMNANGGPAGLEAATYVTWTIAGAAVAVGTTWLIVAIAGHRREPSTTTARAPAVVPLANGVAIRGFF